MQRVPAALLPADWVQTRLIDPVVPKGEVGSVPFVTSAIALWWPWLDASAYTNDSGKRSFMLVIVNKRLFPLTLGYDIAGDDSSYYGNLDVAPCFRGWDEQHGHPVDVGSHDTIPAADPDAGTVGVGIVAFLQGSPYYGCAGTVEIVADDPTFSGPIWVAVQCAEGVTTDDAGNPAYGSIAITDDPGAYGNSKRAFYDKECDKNRRLTGALSLLLGHGNVKTAFYDITAKAALLDLTDTAGFVSDAGTMAWLDQYQGVVVVA